MRKGTLGRIEIYGGIAILLAAFLLAGYGLVSALADRLDPKVRDCVAHSLQVASDSGKPEPRETAVAICKHLEAIGAL